MVMQKFEFAYIIIIIYINNRNKFELLPKNNHCNMFIDIGSLSSGSTKNLGSRRQSSPILNNNLFSMFYSNPKFYIFRLDSHLINPLTPLEIIILANFIKRT